MWAVVTGAPLWVSFTTALVLFAVLGPLLGRWSGPGARTLAGVATVAAVVGAWAAGAAVSQVAPGRYRSLPLDEHLPAFVAAAGSTLVLVWIVWGPWRAGPDRTGTGGHAVGGVLVAAVVLAAFIYTPETDLLVAAVAPTAVMAAAGFITPSVRLQPPGGALLLTGLAWVVAVDGATRTTTLLALSLGLAQAVAPAVWGRWGRGRWWRSGFDRSGGPAALVGGPAVLGLVVIGGRVVGTTESIGAALALTAATLGATAGVIAVLDRRPLTTGQSCPPGPVPPP